jgi:hypothetical protein
VKQLHYLCAQDIACVGKNITCLRERVNNTHDRVSCVVGGALVMECVWPLWCLCNVRITRRVVWQLRRWPVVPTC